MSTLATEPTPAITVAQVIAGQRSTTKTVILRNVPEDVEEDVLLDVALPAAGENRLRIFGWRITFHHEDSVAVVYIYVD